MIVGVLKEIKPEENRIALVPAGAEELVNAGHTVYVENDAGKGSGFPNERYTEVGAKILDTAKEVYKISEMILKVKEPLPQEYSLIQPDQLVFTYFHFAASKELTDAMVNSGAVSIAYETVERPDGTLPLLVPMSEVAGRMAVQVGAVYLEKDRGGRGILMGGVTGVEPAEVLILGGGIVGTNSAMMAAGLGAKVVILDLNLDRLRYLSEIMPRNVFPVASNPVNIRKYLKTADLVVGGVLIPGAKAPKLITRDMLKLMKPGAVIVDVAVDQGGCIETCHPTTHRDPIYVVDEIIHYCVANMPGAVPFTSTLALTNATFPYVLNLANNGLKGAVKKSKDLLYGINVIDKKITYKGVADAFDLPYTPVEEAVSLD